MKLTKILSLALVAVLAFSALALTSCSEDDTYNVGVVQLVQHPALDAATEGFEAALKDALGENVKIDVQNAAGSPDTCATIVSTFVTKNVDLIMANATPALQAAQNATTTIPVLGTSITEYGVALGIDNFTGTVGTNISGTSDLAPLDQQADMILDLIPEAKKVAMLYCSAEANSDYQVKEVTKFLTDKGIAYALKNVHFPADANALASSLKRLAFDEMLYFGISIARAAGQRNKGVGIKFSPCDLSPLLSLLPYELTSSQKNTVNDIYKDTVIGHDGKVSPMARIVVGDVGSGKTICATIAMYIAAHSGYQSALMAPTEILARQHYNDLKKLYSSLGVSVELLLGSTTQKEKRRIYESVSNGTCQVLIGTHALISDKVEFADLGLIITDEQHRFGVNQRAVLKDKVDRAHMLVMSATPIPRTLALAMYGDLDVSRITELPKGRMRVDTFVVDDGYRARLNDFIKKQVLSGGQCYVVCPAIEPPAEEEINGIEANAIINGGLFVNRANLKNALEHAEFLRQKLDGVSVACLHGKMKAAEKDDIMHRFAAGEISVLVSTTVIEVGVNVPNASLMVIENAERFGLSQLHQLRGRVGRGTRKSYCVLVAGTRSEKSDSRLDVMKTTYDGFEIAEKDLILRGPGDFFSSGEGESLRQSGGFDFKLASLCDDTELFSKAFSTAKSIISDDPELKKEENGGLRAELERYLAPRYSTIS